MRNLLKHTLVACGLVAVFMVAAGKANADPLVLTITNPSQSVVAGGTVIFAGTFFNPNNTPFFVNGVGTAANPQTLAILGGFLPPGVFAQVVPAMTTVSADIVGYNIAANAAPGVYTFSIVLVTVQAGDLLISSNFVPVTLTVLPVPEPMTVLLLGTGLAGIVIKVRKRRKAV